MMNKAMVIAGFSCAAMCLSSMPADAQTLQASFKPVLADGFDRQSDIARKYKITTTGCGTQCQSNQIINKETGKVVASITTSFGLFYAMKGNILIADANPAPCDKSDAIICDSYKMYGMRPRTYALTNDKLISVSGPQYALNGAQ